MLSTVDASVRDALVCAVVLLVFARDVDSVANMFGELQLLPDDIVADKQEMAALAQSLNQTFDEVLIYPDPDTITDDVATQIPSLRFDKLLDAVCSLLVCHLSTFVYIYAMVFLSNVACLPLLPFHCCSCLALFLGFALSYRPIS